MKILNININDKADQKLAKKAKKGNKNAFEKLVIKYQKIIYAAVRKIVIDHNITNDIIQDTFVKAFLNIKSFNEQFPFYPWLYRIAINTTLNYQNKITRRQKTFSNIIESDSKQYASNNGNSLTQILQNELQEKVAEALRQLPFEQRIVFILKTSDGLSYREISQQLDISLGTVMSRLSRARTKLKILLRPYITYKDIEE